VTANSGAPPTLETIMTNLTRLTLPALAFALCSAALFAGGIARAENTMKPADAMATDAMKPATDAIKPADPMAAEKMKDCMDKAAMETDAMKKDEATKTCDAMGTAK
jgi:pentapeptide MXKDX repeat protein